MNQKLFVKFAKHRIKFRLMKIYFIDVFHAKRIYTQYVKLNMIKIMILLIILK